MTPGSFALEFSIFLTRHTYLHWSLPVQGKSIAMRSTAMIPSVAFLPVRQLLGKDFRCEF